MVTNANLNFKSDLIPLKLDKVKFIVIHHIAADFATPGQIHDWHLSNGWAGAGYNEYIRKDGTVYIMRGDNIGAQCQGFNSCSYGISLEGNYDISSDCPDAQYQALLDRIRFNLSRFPKNCVVVPHRELYQTSCPGKLFPMTKLLSDINIGSDVLKQALDTLVRNGVMKSPEYWYQTAIPDSLCKGEYVRQLLINFATYVNSKG